jgi:hypothetical protein
MLSYRCRQTHDPVQCMNKHGFFGRFIGHHRTMRRVWGTESDTRLEIYSQFTMSLPVPPSAATASPLQVESRLSSLHGRRFFKNGTEGGGSSKMEQRVHRTVSWSARVRRLHEQCCRSQAETAHVSAFFFLLKILATAGNCRRATCAYLASDRYPKFRTGDALRQLSFPCHIRSDKYMSMSHTKPTYRWRSVYHRPAQRAITYARLYKQSTACEQPSARQHARKRSGWKRAQASRNADI